jgi:carbon-monoxide dehydrogenase medium subunit
MTILCNFKYLKPKSLQEAIDILAIEDSAKNDGSGAASKKVIAGGQSLIPLMKMGLTDFDILIDVSEIPELKIVELKGDFLEVGAMIRHSELESYSDIGLKCPILIKVAGQIGDPQIRHRGTIGGAIAHGDPASDLAGCFIALKATAVVASKQGVREISFADFYEGFLQTTIKEDELLVSLKFPVNSKNEEFYKISKRVQDWAISGLVVVEINDQLSFGIISMGSKTLHFEIDKSELSDNLDSVISQIESICSPTEDIYASKQYRLHLLRTFLTKYRNSYLT